MKKAISLMLACVLCLSLCSCGKSEAVKNVEALIDAIGEVTVDSGDAIATAESAYNALTEEEKAKVSGLEKLSSAKVDYVEIRIASLGEIAIESEETILSIEGMFSALSAEEQAAVENADVLIAARTTLEELKFEQLRLSFVGEWLYLSDSIELSLTLNEDGTATYCSFDEEMSTEWTLSKDGAEISFEYWGIPLSCKVGVADSYVFLNCEMLGASFVRKADYQAIVDQYLTVVEITSENYSDYLGTVEFSRDVMDEWGEKVYYTIFAFSNTAYDNGLTVVGFGGDYRMEYAAGGYTNTLYYPYVFYDFQAHTPEEINIKRVKGTLTFVSNDIVESVTYASATRKIKLKNGLVFDNYFSNNNGMGGLSDDELAMLNFVS